MPSNRRSLHASKGQELNSPTPQILRGSLAGWQVPPLGTAEQHREGLGASRASTPYAHVATLVPLPLTPIVRILLILRFKPFPMQRIIGIEQDPSFRIYF